MQQQLNLCASGDGGSKLLDNLFHRTVWSHIHVKKFHFYSNSHRALSPVFISLMYHCNLDIIWDCSLIPWCLNQMLMSTCKRTCKGNAYNTLMFNMFINSVWMLTHKITKAVNSSIFPGIFLYFTFLSYWPPDWMFSRKSPSFSV